jgi:crotonobetainyl-CoA:carnitine CoA-transferase CaiB-like acyl-CoA transferase
MVGGADLGRRRPAAAAVERGRLLGLACGLVPRAPIRVAGTPWRIERRDARSAVGLRRPPHVVNLGALWAGPLAAQLLHRAGCTVTDVESTRRRETGPTEFYRSLHRGHARAVLDFDSDRGRAELTERLRDADVVIEASRPRALRQLGVDADTIMADGRPRVWLRITGHLAHPNAIAFGDDAAASAGLVARDAAGPVFAGDAIADPLTGLLTALVGLASLRAGGSWLVDLGLGDVARYAASGS